MKYYGKISDPKDFVTKEYTDHNDLKPVTTAEYEAMEQAGTLDPTQNYLITDDETDANFQPIIEASGVLIGDGIGNITGKTLDTSSLSNDNNHIPTSGVVKSGLSNKLNKYGDSGGTYVIFPDASSRANISSGDTLVQICSKIKKWFADLGTLECNSDNSVYGFRQSGGGVTCEDTEVISELTGGTVAWNQLTANDIVTTTINYVTFTKQYDGYTVDGTATGNAYIYTDASIHSRFITNHIYYFCGCPSNGSDSTYRLGLTSNGNSVASEYGSGEMYKELGTNEGVPLSTVIFVTSGATVNNIKFRPQVFDLTQMFGSTIADYIYTLEQGTAGAGVAFFRSLFSNAYYAYNAGQLISVNPSAHKTVGFNQWDEQWRNGFYDSTTGVYNANSNFFANKNLIPVFSSTEYYFKHPVGMEVFEYDINKHFIRRQIIVSLVSFTTSENTKFINFSTQVSGAYTSYNHDICINISDASRNGTYEPYKSYSNPFGGIEIRGVPKLVNNALTFDGDSYKCDGQLTRKYGIVDLGTLDWYVSNGIMASSTYPNNVKKPSDALVLTDWIITVKYIPSTPSMVYNKDADKTIAIRQENGAVYIYDSAYTDATTFKAAMSGVYLVYELATPITESVDPFTSCQVCDPDGTEEWVDAQVVAGTRDVSMPVQALTKYPVGYAADVAQVLMPVTAYAPIVETNEKVEKTDITNLILTGTTNNTGSSIAAGTYFYLNGVPVKAKTSISNGATFTLNTNYTLVPNGVANDLKSATALVEGTITNDYAVRNTIVNYPTGFSIQNCIITACFNSNDNGVSWYPMNPNNLYAYMDYLQCYIYDVNLAMTGRKYRLLFQRFI